MVKEIFFRAKSYAEARKKKHGFQFLELMRSVPKKNGKKLYVAFGGKVK